MKEKTARRSSAEWATLVAQQSQSGQTIATFCKNQGLVQATFIYWRQKLTKQASAPAGFVPVVPGPASLKDGLLLRGRHGVEIEVPRNTPLDTIRQLISALSC